MGLVFFSSSLEEQLGREKEKKTKKNSKKTQKTHQGYCVLLGSCIRSVPQIIKIVQNKSVEGLSLAANGAELLAYSITFAYNWR